MRNKRGNCRWAFAITTAVLLTAPVLRAQSFQVIRSFTGTPDGANPYSGLIADDAGNLYGTTLNGGAFGYGSVFMIGASGGESVLYSFTGGSDGAYPVSNLTLGGAGDLYGTTTAGGVIGGVCAAGCGVVFKLHLPSTETVVYSFSGGADGLIPRAGLIRDSDGSFYGTTEEGGISGGCLGSGCGVVLRIDPSGTETVLHAFNGPPDGQFPVSPLARDNVGNLYGLASEGGISGACIFREGCGVVFKIDASDSETVLYTFTGGADGGVPTGSLALDPLGNLYGTTFYDGNVKSCLGMGCGVVFELDAAGNETVLVTFRGPNGASPEGGVIRDLAGNLYGTTYGGGDLSCFVGVGCGAVFKLSPSGKETLLHTFSGKDGEQPLSQLMAYKGYLYSTTSVGGTGNVACGQGCGVVFKVLP